MKKIFFAVLLGFMVFFTVPAQAQNQFNLNSDFDKSTVKLAYGWDGAYVVRCNEWITLRDRPSVYGDSLARMPLGSYLEVREGSYENGFYHVRWRGLYGYALASYISY